MLERLDVLKMAGDRVLLFFEFGQHHECDIMMLEVFQQLLVVLEVDLNCSPIYGNGLDANLRVALHCDFSSLRDVYLMPHEDEIEAIGCQKSAVFEVILAVGNQSPREMAVLIQQLQLSQHWIGSCHCFFSESKSGFSNGQNADKHCEVDKGFIIVFEVEVQQFKRGELRKLVPQRCGGRFDAAFGNSCCAHIYYQLQDINPSQKGRKKNEVDKGKVVVWQVLRLMRVRLWQQYNTVMKYLKSLAQLEEQLKANKAILVIFVDPNQFMPAKSLLNYLFSHPLMKYIDPFVFIWNTVDQQVYEKYQIVAFPQTTILSGEEARFSFIGYNREKANESVQLFCLEFGLGKAKKQLNPRVGRCINGHEMSLAGQQKNGSYPGGCFKCNLCSKLSHFQKERPSLHCEICQFDVCPLCCYEEVLA